MLIFSEEYPNNLIYLIMDMPLKNRPANSSSEHPTADNDRHDHPGEICGQSGQDRMAGSLEHMTCII